MGFKKFSAQRLINQYKFTRNRTSASGLLPMPNLPSHYKGGVGCAQRNYQIGGYGNPSARCAVARINIRAMRNCVPRPGTISCPVRPATPPTGKGNIRRSGTVADNACCGGAGTDRTAALPVEWVGLGALLRNPSAPLFPGARRLAQWTEALLRNSGRPGAKLFKALLRNSFTPFLRGRRGNARQG